VIVFAADLHLSPLIWQDMPGLYGDAYTALGEIVEYCIKNKPVALILGGDIFDRTRPDSQSVDVFLSAMQLMADNNILVYAIQGQHERADPPWARVSKRVRCSVESPFVTVTDGDVDITIGGLDNMPMTQLQTALASMKPVPDILVLHQMAKEVMPIDGAWDFDMEWVPKDVKLVLAGDYHIPTVPPELGRLVYAGSTHMRSLDELGPHSFITVAPLIKKKSAKSKTSVWTGAFDVQRVPFHGRTVIQLRVMTPEDLTAALDTLDKAAVVKDDKLVYMKYSPAVQDALQRISDVCKAKGLFLRTKSMSVGTEVVADVPQIGEATLEACLSRMVNRVTDPALFSFVLSLLQAQEPRAALDAAKKQLNI
jgi:DNA repair exonuclease SbcCD nuclease subunit